MTSENTTTLKIPLQFSESITLQTFRLVLYGLITAASFLGNAVVVKSIVSIPYRKPFTYHMVTNLAVAELLGSLLLPLVQVYDELMTWPFGDLLCHLVFPGQMTAGLVVTWTLAIISIHRYRTIVNHRMMNVAGNLHSLLIGFLWLAAVVLALPSFLYSTLVKSPYDKHSYWCVVMFPGDTLQNFPSQTYRTYILVRFVINFIIPVLIMMVAYGSIGLKLRYHMAMNQTADSELSTQQTVPTSLGIELAAFKSDAFQPDNSTEAVIDNPANVLETTLGRNNCPQQSPENDSVPLSQRVDILFELEHDLLRMIYVIVLVFIVCYFPYQIFFLLEYFQILKYTTWEFFFITRKFIFLITCLPSALHPLCYGTMSKFYGKAFSAMVLCKCTIDSNDVG